jgi:hypothetical protein
MARKSGGKGSRASGTNPSAGAEPPRPAKWTRRKLLAELRALHAAGEDLSTSGVRMVTGRSGILVAGQKLFGTYANAVEAAGIDYDTVSRQRRWRGGDLLEELRQRHRKGQSLAPNRHASPEVKTLHSAAVRVYGSYRAALVAAGVDPADVYVRHVTGRATDWIVYELRERHRAGKSLAINQKDPELRRLYSAAKRHFGSYAEALRAANLTNP